MRNIEEIEKWIWNKVNKREISALATYIQQLEQRNESLSALINECDKAYDTLYRDYMSLAEESSKHTAALSAIADSDDCIGE